MLYISLSTYASLWSVKWCGCLYNVCLHSIRAYPYILVDQIAYLLWFILQYLYSKVSPTDLPVDAASLQIDISKSIIGATSEYSQGDQTDDKLYITITGSSDLVQSLSTSTGTLSISNSNDVANTSSGERSTGSNSMLAFTLTAGCLTTTSTRNSPLCLLGGAIVGYATKSHGACTPPHVQVRKLCIWWIYVWVYYTYVCLCNMYIYYTPIICKCSKFTLNLWYIYIYIILYIYYIIYIHI